MPLSQIRASFPVLKNPANRHKAVGLTFEQWNYTFTNGFPEDEARRLYERYHIPASGEIFWGSALANIHPGKDDTWVDYGNDDRAPLLFISGSSDHLMPPSIQRSNAKHYKSDTVTEVKEFEGPHLLPAWPGWEQVADYALDWALRHARQSSPSEFVQQPPWIPAVSALLLLSRMEQRHGLGWRAAGACSSSAAGAPRTGRTRALASWRERAPGEHVATQAVRPRGWTTTPLRPRV